MRLGLKGLTLLLLAVVLLCSSVHLCDARSGKHWRQNNAPSTSLLRRKGKGKSSSSHRQSSKGNHNPYQPSPNVPITPSGSPVKGKGGQSPTMPAPSGGNDYTLPSPPLLQPPPPPPPAAVAASSSQNTIFNVVDFGAKGDGVTDDTQAFEAAWAAACKVEASTVLVPSELEFVVGPISFSGPYCKRNILFQLDGTILAQASPRTWGSGLLQWLEFTKLTGIAIQGSGVINGRGQEWWTYSDPNDDPNAFNVELEKMPQIKPTALRFYGSSNVTVTGITIVNSSQCHLKFDSCEGVMVHDLTISSPENSPNTDGIHLQNSKQVNIHHTNLACGDDCVSIQTGCSDINIHNVNCGPGHGISIGGLGRYNTKACVSNITVRDVNMFKTMTGVRIKTWQGGSGLVQGIRFSNIHVSEVQTPIIIDQFYCDKTTCINQTSAVAVSGVQYENIRGTFTIKPAHFACSDSSPCSEIALTGIQLKPLMLPQYHLYNPFCWQAFGELYTPTVPPIPCLQIGKPAGNSVLSDRDRC
ncbi:polygalacturonase At1g48100-like isoform X1 [Phragmites australis]|uniref:polygalacturonase At1g48100-like isoform X1 n=1 Tax=Phragmites australis TaxID=29695 RepID=UPI002D77BFF0|nr:polygalacturonase At1g48100-like isoform X1 [Phragmites australis]